MSITFNNTIKENKAQKIKFTILTSVPLFLNKKNKTVSGSAKIEMIKMS